MRYKITSKSGFTLIEIITVLAIVGILGATITPLVFMTLHTQREGDTIAELKELKKGILGNPVIITKEVRTDFGYIGDMGSIPTQIEDLYQKGTQPAFAYDATKQTGAGWKGPYIDPSLVENLASLKLDAYGNEYTYSTTPFTDTTVGVTVLASITSKGSDGTTGGGDDLNAYTYEPEAFSTVHGIVVDEQGNRVPSVTVKMNYASGGTLVTAATTSDSTGHYQFTNIPYGNRSITVEPWLVYAADSAEVFGKDMDRVRFKITNLSANDISITSFKAEYTIVPAAYYERLDIGGITVYDNATSRLASGDTVTFSAIVIPGSGAVTTGKTFPARVQSPLTRVEDLDIGSGASKGGSITIEMRNFVDNPSVGGTKINMAGVRFVITFSDGSKVVFSPSA
ncbi:MAG: carboxypeptidase regulatory-like domain-containing protein [Candidatus Brocadiales bacterium]